MPTGFPPRTPAAGSGAGYPGTTSRAQGDAAPSKNRPPPAPKQPGGESHSARVSCCKLWNGELVGCGAVECGPQCLAAQGPWGAVGVE